MNRLFWIIIFLALINATTFGQTISTLNIIPESPTPTDVIIARVFGEKPVNANLDHTHFLQVDNNLTLELYWDGVIINPAYAGYTVDEELGTFAKGQYNLTVKSIWKMRDLVDEESITFTVIPEATTLSLLTLGGLAVLRRIRK